MRTKSRPVRTMSRPWALAVVVTLAVATIGGLMPVGIAWGNSSRGRICLDVPLWRALDQLPAMAREAGSPEEFWKFERDNIACAGCVALAAAGAGWATYRGARRHGPPEAADYADGPGGVIPDGRAASPAQQPPAAAQ